ncbi:MAG: hypothetical protein RIG84_02120 [Roseovarius sp.]
MTRLVARYVTILLVTLAILAPLGGWALAGLGLAGDRVIVICTGDGLRTLRLAPDGTPQEISDKADLCALVHAADTAVPPRPVAPAPRLLTALSPELARALDTPRPGHPSSLPRAPPPV